MVYDHQSKSSSWTPTPRKSSFFPPSHIQTKTEAKKGSELVGKLPSKAQRDKIRRSLFGDIPEMTGAKAENAPTEAKAVENPTQVSEEAASGEIQAKAETGLSQSQGYGVPSREVRNKIRRRLFGNLEPTPVQKQGEGTSPPTPLLQGEGSMDDAGGEEKGLAETEISLPIQAKLTIGEPNDKYEQEADTVARQVVDKIHSPTPETVQREEMGDEDEVRLKSDAGSGGKLEAGVGVRGVRKSPIEGVRVNRKVNSEGETQEASAELEASIQGKRGSGQPLDESVKEPMEGAFGADFSGVRVHTDGKSDELNQAIQAKAFTTGEDIFFREGAYEPGSKGGQELLAHELTHVVQQSGETVQRSQSRRTEQTQPKAEIFAGNEFIQEKKDSSPTSILPAQSISQSQSTIQRLLEINGKQYTDPEEIRDEAFEVAGASAAAIENLVIKAKERRKHWYANWQEALAENDYMDDFEDVDLWDQKDIGPKRQEEREEWWNSDQEGIWTLEREDPLFTELVAEILMNHHEKPYSTDALHETGRIMQGWMQSKPLEMIKGIFDKDAIVGKNPDERPHIQITRIQMIKNKQLLEEYEKAKEEIESRNNGNANERSLYSGHGVAGMDYITQHGHAPDYGQYDSAKGHGAHGRGAYFTDQVDKAVSYARKDQQEEEERSFFKQDVLLGNTYEYEKRGTYRHSHHNEMVREARSARNKTVAEGRTTEGLEAYDSLEGKKSYEPGANLLGTAVHSDQFDSDEYMVRNADQIYVKFRIFYKIVDKK